MEKLNFNNESSKKLALSIIKKENSNILPADALLLLIKGVSQQDLSNLCMKIQSNFYPIEISLEECYKITQSSNLSKGDKDMILSAAYQCLNEGLHLGNKTILDGKINTSAWISHSIYAGEVCEILAKNLGINADEAKSLGFLHDYGRKFDHSFNHVIKGFEELAALGFKQEAIGCLTHSFVNGGRCSNNEKAVDGFYLDDSGNAKWKEDVEKDEITLFLENYQYSDYDVLLNIADLMATDKGIVSPYERIKDIATRRTIDPTNRGYFLCDITNVLINFLNKNNSNKNGLKEIKATKDLPLDQIERHFFLTSNDFFEFFNNQKEFQQQNTFKK